MANETDEFKLKRYEILEAMNARFGEIVKELNNNGSALSKELAEEVKKNFLDNQVEHKALKDWMKYELDTLKTTNKIILEPDRGLIPRMEKKVETAIALASDACKSNADSKLLVIESKKEVGKASWYLMANVFILVAFAVGAFAVYVELASKASKDLVNQGAMISALHEKLKQDADNQNRTEAIMNKLYKKLGGQ
jgi:hypothetical protein